MDPKQPSMDVGSESEEDMQCSSDSSVLIQFIYDTSFFSDRLVQLAAIDTTTELVRAEDHDPASDAVEADNTDGNRDTGSVEDSFYPQYLVIE